MEAGSGRWRPRWVLEKMERKGGGRSKCTKQKSEDLYLSVNKEE